MAQAARENQLLKNLIRTLEEQNAAKQSECQTLIQHLDKSLAQNHALRDEIESLHRQYSQTQQNLHHHLAALQNQNDELVFKLRHAENQNVVLQNSLQQCTVRINMFEDQIRQQEMQNKSTLVASSSSNISTEAYGQLEQASREMTKNNEELTNRVRQLEVIVKILREAEQQWGGEKQHLVNSLQKLQTEIRTLKQNNDSSQQTNKQEVIELVAEKQKLLSQVTMLHNQRQTLLNTEQQLGRRVSDLQLEITKKTTETQNKQKQLERSLEARDQTILRNKSQFVEVSAENQRLVSQLQDLQRTLSLAQLDSVRLQQLQQQYNLLKSQMQHKYDSQIDNDRSLQKLRDQLQATKAELAQQRNQNDNYSIKIELLNKELTETRQILENMQKETSDWTEKEIRYKAESQVDAATIEELRNTIQGLRKDLEDLETAKAKEAEVRLAASLPPVGSEIRSAKSIVSENGDNNKEQLSRLISVNFTLSNQLQKVRGQLDKITSLMSQNRPALEKYVNNEKRSVRTSSSPETFKPASTGLIRNVPLVLEMDTQSIEHDRRRNVVSPRNVDPKSTMSYEANTWNKFRELREIVSPAYIQEEPEHANKGLGGRNSQYYRAKLVAQGKSSDYNNNNKYRETVISSDKDAQRIGSPGHSIPSSKWLNLQKRILDLKAENESLKKSLFHDY